jgi:uncharacterized protein (DUF433 family)
MSTLSEAEQVISGLSRSDKAQLLEVISRELGGAFAGIDIRPDVCGGEPCIVRTRIPVWLLEQARRLGSTDSEILASFPALRPGDLAFAWLYVHAHPNEIDRQISDNEAA